ncbi:16S rRNA (cytosine(967)-C(5))-methyltransferase RsmB [Chakrabartyella piscis]|uniref:16S rRNA (cytosine(967)-C(5))-methyltransferase RsmB n=1 Tax=Chakrabartyella piscis TaxID=2918914 RepID=UPI002958B078|nr:16S rRNA (cytosine(967)-C(5))-methyltransferase RsmB [Chakrabartyella piscis]
MIQINPREVAVDALLEILQEGAYNNMVLRKVLRQNGAMQQKDKALVTEMVNGTLRNLYYVDYVINQFSKTKTEKMKPLILAVMRLSVYQMMFMNIPDSAACNEGVKLVESRGYRQLKGFANGVLRTIGREKDKISLPDENTAEYLHVVYSHPLWLVKMWIAYYGFEETKAICIANNKAPDVSISVNTLKISTEELTKRFEKRGIQVKPGMYADDALHLKGSADLGRMEEFTKGYFHVQDESSQLAVKILDPQKGESILDLCAAPGGKSFTIAKTMENTGKVVSGDIYEHKIELMADGANRLGYTIVQPTLQDATVWNDAYVESFDRVLVDAPCSGFGLIGKKPDIRLKKSGVEIDDLVPVQKDILENAGRYVKAGGVLVYSTCTLSRKENEKNVEWFLANNEDFVAEDISEYIPKEWSVETAKAGYIALLPHISGTDGFFVSKLRRKG